MPFLSLPRAVRALMALTIAASVAGCFQPLYGSRTASPTGGGANVATAMASVDVQQIAAASGSPESRLAVELRNRLLFDLTGGPAPSIPSHQLKIKLVSTRLSVIVDVTTARPDNEIYGLNAYYELIESGTGKVVLRDNTFSRVSYDIPGQQQRFARQRGLRDAENRATQVISDSIRNRVASYFAAGS